MSTKKELSDHAYELLAELQRQPVPRQEVNPGLAKLLVDRRLADAVDLPSPYKTRPGTVKFLQITDEGRIEIAAHAKKAAEPHVVTLSIDNCLDCPHSMQIRDPSSRDSFDSHDVSLCCAKEPVTGRSKTDLGDKIPGRIIVGCERSIEREAAKVPAWCPLLKKEDL